MPLMEGWSHCDRGNGRLPVLLYILVEVEAASPCDLSERWTDITLQLVVDCELVAKFQETWVMGMESVPTGLMNERE